MTTINPWTEDATLESALADCGWEFDGAFTWRLHTARGGSVLEQTAFHDDWLRFTLCGRGVPKAKSANILQRNAALNGPAKFVPGDQRKPMLRLDVPADNTEWMSGSGGWNEDLHLLDPHHVWANAVTRMVRREDAAPANAGLRDRDAIADEIGRCGWAATVDDGEVHIHFQMPGVFRQARIEEVEGVSVKLAADLLLLDGLSDESLRAIALLAVEANARLPLVRFADATDAAGRVLRAEVHFGSTLIPGAWLATSLEVLEHAIALTARELEALRDPELAKLVVTASAV